MDARLDPAKYAGLSEGDAHVIRKWYDAIRHS
jgi:carbonic anhydrase